MQKNSWCDDNDTAVRSIGVALSYACGESLMPTKKRTSQHNHGGSRSWSVGDNQGPIPDSTTWNKSIFVRLRVTPGSAPESSPNIPECFLLKLCHKQFTYSGPRGRRFNSPRTAKPRSPETIVRPECCSDIHHCVGFPTATAAPTGILDLHKHVWGLPPKRRGGH